MGSSKSGRGQSRRQFLASSLMGSAGALILPTFIPRTYLLGAQTPPSRRINIAQIGCGRMGTEDLRGTMAHDLCRIVAVCDLDNKRLAAAKATLEVIERDNVCAHLHRIGTRLLHGLHRLQGEHAAFVTAVGGVAEMCFLHFASEHVSRDVARGCAGRGVLFKRTAYNFVSLAHDEAVVDRTLDVLERVLRDLAAQP